MRQSLNSAPELCLAGSPCTHPSQEHVHHHRDGDLRKAGERFFSSSSLQPLGMPNRDLWARHRVLHPPGMAMVSSPSQLYTSPRATQPREKCSQSHKEWVCLVMWMLGASFNSLKPTPRSWKGFAGIELVKHCGRASDHTSAHLQPVECLRAGSHEPGYKRCKVASVSWPSVNLPLLMAGGR